MIRFLKKHPTLVILIKLLVIAAFALAITVPFASLPFSFDGPLVLDFAESQMVDPLKQHIDDFDYFGFRYDRFFNTHPRLLSFYLAVVIQLVGGISEVPVHLSLAIFPVIAGTGMFFLGRRFGVSGVTAALLLLSGGAFMVHSHIEMVDVPGTSLWIAGLAAFIHGVDRNRLWLLLLAALLFLLTIFTFYQGLTVLGLALIYLLAQRRLSLRTLLPVVLPALIFVAYLGWFYSFYDEFPRFTYRRGIALYDRTPANQARSVITILGGAMIFPLVILAACFRNWRAALAGTVAAAATWPWVYVKYSQGVYGKSESLLMAVFFVAGLVAVYQVLDSLFDGVVAWFRRRDHDAVMLCIWFLAVTVYCIFILGYPAPRYLLPAAAPMVLIILRLWRQRRRSWPVARNILAGTAIGLTLSLSLALSMAYETYAREAPATADWFVENYGDRGGRLWFSGELGLTHYMRKNGVSMLPNVCGRIYSQTEGPFPAEAPQTGDVILFSSLYGRWFPYPEVMARTRVIDYRRHWSQDPVVMITPSESLWDISIFLLPYKVTDAPTSMEEIYIMEIVDEAGLLSPELQQAVDTCY